MATLQELEDQLNKAQQANLLPAEKNSTVKRIKYFIIILFGYGIFKYLCVCKDTRHFGLFIT